MVTSARSIQLPVGSKGLKKSEDVCGIQELLDDALERGVCRRQLSCCLCFGGRTILDNHSGSLKLTPSSAVS